MVATLATAVGAALATRGPLLAALHAERTDCYRLFHGATEGMPGLTLDRYNELLVLNTFREPPPGLLEELADVHAAVSEALPGVDLAPVYWCDRRRGAPGGGPAPALPAVHHSSELGLRYLIDVPGQGRDPGLFLDFRAARRWIRDHSAGRDVLNAFVSCCHPAPCATPSRARPRPCRPLTQPPPPSPVLHVRRGRGCGRRRSS
jgi:23S rRNA (cytosine1962-C5)-methyltransferase